MNTATNVRTPTIGTSVRPPTTPTVTASTVSTPSASSVTSAISPDTSSLFSGNTGSSSSSGISGTTTLMTPASSSGSTTSSFFTSPWFIGIIVILLLAVVGINVFSYLSSGTSMFADNVGPALSGTTGGISTFFNNLLNTTESGGKGFVELVSETLKSAISIPDQIVKGTVVSSDKGQKINSNSADNAGSVKEKTVAPDGNSLQKKIDKHTVKKVSKKDTGDMKSRAEDQELSGKEPTPMESSETSTKSTGFCYIGEEDGNRTCISIDDSTKCMSGEIFKTREKCVRP